jgi:hypothetical protein
MPASSSDPRAPGVHLLVRAGGRTAALDSALVGEVRRRAAWQRLPVPGSMPWFLGLTVWRGRLLSLCDGGQLLFETPAGFPPTTGGPTSDQAPDIVVLRGLPVDDVAISVDTILGPAEEWEDDVRVVGIDVLCGHPAFQPGAATAPGEPQAGETIR